MSSENVFFKPISSRFTIREKIEFAAYKYNNNYFLDQEPSEITNLPNEIVRPMCKITKDNLNEAVSRDQRAKTKKLAWVLKQLDDEYLKLVYALLANERKLSKAAHVTISVLSRLRSP